MDSFRPIEPGLVRDARFPVGATGTKAKSILVSTFKAVLPPAGFLIVAVVWLGSLFIVNPAGNFPINDDWSFASSVQHLINHHEFRPTGWAAMTLLTNVLWGSLFCIPFGFSFTVLRASSLVAALLGMFGAYWMVKQSRQPSWLAALVTLTLGFNPIFYALSYTFMTDVLFTTLTVYSAGFFLRHLRNGSDFDLVPATAFAVLATLSRQLAIAVPLAFAISLILKGGFKRRNLWRALVPAIVSIGILFLFQHWMAATGRLPALYEGKSRQLLQAVTHPVTEAPIVAYNFYIGFIYLGLFLFPVLICATAGAWTSHRKKIPLLFAAALWSVLLLVFLCRANGIFMPLIGNIIQETGIGPLALRDIALLRHNVPPALPPLFWRTTTCISLLGATFLLTFVGFVLVNCLPKLKPATLGDGEIAAIFLLLTTVIYLFPILCTSSFIARYNFIFFDRYFIPAIPLLAVAVISIWPPRPRPDWKIAATAVTIGAALACFAVGGTRDYLEWQRLRWRAVNNLMADDHVKPGEIDGGFEFNGRYLYDPNHEPITGGKKSWWWVQQDTYLISGGPVPGYELLHEYHFSHWMPPCKAQIFVLKKTGDEK